MQSRFPIALLVVIWCVGSVPLVHAQEPGQKVVEYELTIEETTIERRGKRGVLLTINGESPAPTLRFTEGDWARITVRNRLPDEDTSTHWHGLLVPNAMDGVPYLTTPSLPPGEDLVFEFPLRQAGTYWYHSHTGLQEQQGLYGAIVIEPKEPQRTWDREHVVVLSDWTHEDPRTVMRTLMQGSDWYAIQKKTARSIYEAYRAGRLQYYFDVQKLRSMPMDLSDVAYDAFLAGGQEELALEARPGERVLLRVINAAASSYFHLTSATDAFEIVAADGLPVQPVEVPRFLMGVAETYDLVVTMPEEARRIEVRASAHDASGHASIWLGTGKEQRAPVPPKPDLYRSDETVDAGLASQFFERGLEATEHERPFAPYSHLRSPEPRVVPDPASVRTIKMRLTGEMSRYLWGIDGKTLSEESVIPISAGEVLRIEMINDTMMHHPMHLHGHFFRVLNGQGEFAPLKHTVDVPPMGKRTIEWVADEEPGDWFFHCHVLYHMDAGMARVFSYREQGPDHEPSFDPNLIRPRMVKVQGMVLDHMSMGMAMVMEGKNDYYVRWSTAEEHGAGGHGGHRDEEVDFGYARYIDPNWKVFGAYRTTKMRAARDRGVVGFHYRAPYHFMTTWSADTEGDLRVDLMKELQLLPRWTLGADFQYDTNIDAEWGVTLHYRHSREFGLVAHEHSDHGFGVGLSFQF